MPLVPASLFGRTLLVLAAGLLAAQAATLVLNFFDRGSSVYRLAAYQITARIAQTARILSGLPPAQRGAVARQIHGQHLRVELSDRRVPVQRGFAEHDPYEKTFTSALQQQIGAPWPVSVEITPAGGAAQATAFETWLARHFYFALPGTFSLVVQVGLEDGSVAVFHAAIPHEPLSRFESLVPRLLLLLAVCFALAAYLVRMTTRPLARLAKAADAVGDAPADAPLEVSGSAEVRKVIEAFNRMQARVRRQLRERAQLLGFYI